MGREGKKPKSGPPQKDGPYRGKRGPRVTGLKTGHYMSWTSRYISWSGYDKSRTG
jgi:hypothetical protein